MSAAFHLNNKEAKRELKVNYSNEILPCCPKPKYLEEILDRSLTYMAVASGGEVVPAPHLLCVPHCMFAPRTTTKL